MMKTITQQLKALSADGRVKNVIICDFQPYGADACQNCDGMGKVYVWLLTDGPFDNPPGGKKVGHWINGKWWTGNLFGDTCPVCKGSGKNGKV